MSYKPNTTIRNLFEVGMHYGHKSSKTNPQMYQYIYGSDDNDIDIINLKISLPLLQKAANKVYDVVRNNGRVLFVGTKRCSDLISEYAEKSGQFYVNHRWRGGMLTNWNTISNSIGKMEQIEKKLNSSDIGNYMTKKEIQYLSKDHDKLLKDFAGIRNMGGVPELVIIFNTKIDNLAVTEAAKLKIPMIAILDTNCSTKDISYPVPGNDDALRAIELYCQVFSDAALKAIEDTHMQNDNQADSKNDAQSFVKSSNVAEAMLDEAEKDAK